MDKNARVEDIMTRNVIVVSEEDNLSELTTGLDRYRFHHLPVVDGDKLVGMISQGDLPRASLTGTELNAVTRSREAHYLEETFVRDVMHTDVVTAQRTELVSAAAERMLRARVGALPVVDEAGTLVGIVTKNDIVRLVAAP